VASKPPQGRGTVPVSEGGRLSRAAPAGRKPSITDVARIAGVSYQTVSRVINAAPDVSAETRARVLKIIQDVGYRRNMTATALVTSRSTVIGIVTDGSPRYGPVAMLLAIETAAREAGYGLKVVTVKEPYNASVQPALDFLEDAGVDGIIVIAPLLTLAAAVRKARLRIPVEMVAAGASSTPAVFTYSEDQEFGARMATQHLIDLGHTDIAHVGGSAAWFDGRVRKRGWKSALRDAGLPAGLYVEGDWSPGQAYETGLLLVKKGLPGAIFAASDHMALGLIRAFWENGIRVPGDVSVVGYDDIDGSDFFLPPLTTVRQDFTALGRGSVERLVGSIEGREVDWTPITPVLVVRDSTAPPVGERTASGTPAVAPGIVPE
jgi:DNA-binding LacI/PurR family transcriptional regulator